MKRSNSFKRSYLKNQTGVFKHLRGKYILWKLIVGSLRLEHEECLVLTLKQVEKENPFRLVGDGWCKAFTGNHVPASCLVLKLFISVELSLNLSGEFFIQLVILTRCIADSNCDVLQVLWHVWKPHSVLWERFDFFFFFSGTHFLLNLITLIKHSLNNFN